MGCSVSTDEDNVVPSPSSFSNNQMDIDNSNVVPSPDSQKVQDIDNSNVVPPPDSQKVQDIDNRNVVPPSSFSNNQVDIGNVVPPSSFSNNQVDIDNRNVVTSPDSQKVQDIDNSNVVLPPYSQKVQDIDNSNVVTSPDSQKVPDIDNSNVVPSSSFSNYQANIDSDEEPPSSFSNPQKVQDIDNSNVVPPSSFSNYQATIDGDEEPPSSFSNYQVIVDGDVAPSSSFSNYQANVDGDGVVPSSSFSNYQANVDGDAVPPPSSFSNPPQKAQDSDNENEFSDEESESPDFYGINRIPPGTIKLSFKLGEGAFGQVYKGQWEKRPVAMKTVNLEHARNIPGMTDENIKESLNWEVSRISTVNHPNCVQFYGIYQNKINCRSYIVMEFCAGGTLQRKLEKSSAISWDLGWKWSLEMSKGLYYLHQQGILHRDLKAENILLDNHGVAKLADLGVAQVDSLIEESEAKVVADGLQDKRFIAPENLQNPSLSTKMTDIYALGLVFWQIAAIGKIPRHPNELTSAEKKEWRTETTFMRELIPEDCPESYKKIILSCWATDPKNRPEIETVIQHLSTVGVEYHQQSSLIQAMQKLEELLYPKLLEGLSYIPPYLTKSQVNESIDQYWARLEAVTTDGLPDEESTTKVKEEISDKRQSLIYFDHQYSDSIQPTTKLSNPPLSLKGIFEEFLNDQTSTLLLLGDSGLGKSLSAHLLAHNLLYNFREYMNKSVDFPLDPFYRLPLLIRPSLSFWSHNELNDGFKKALDFYGLIEKIPFLVIVDGYDECVLSDTTPQNIWKVLNIPTHLNIKMIITCRPNTDLITNIESWFKNSPDLKVNYFLPFNITQLLNYLKNYLSWDENTLKKHKEEFKNADQLRSVLRNPFVLSLMAQSWGTVTQSTHNLNSIDRWCIYEGFVHHWIKTKRSLLSQNVQKILWSSSSDTQITETNSDEEFLLLDSFQRFAGEVAFQLFLDSDTSLSQEKIKLKSMKSEWFGIDSLIQKESEDFFNNRNKHLGGRRSLLTINDYVQIKRAHLNQFQAMSPLKCRSGTYEFSHKSFFEYFSAKNILLLAKEKDKASIIKKALELLNKQSLQREPEILKFWIEGFNKQERDVLTQPLFDIIKLSREDKNFCQASSNAATLLATGRVAFSGQDLSGVNIQDADLTGAILHYTSFKDACLNGVQLIGAFLGNTDFRGASMLGVSFGLYPKILFDNVVKCVSFSPDGKTVACATDFIIQIWNIDVECEIPFTELTGHNDEVNTVSFSPDGKTLASGSYDNSVRLWDVESLELLAELNGHTSSVNSVSFSPDGKTLASGSADKTIKLWDVESQKPFAELKGHTHSVSSVSFSPDGKTLATASLDKTVRLWDVESQKPLVELNGHTNNVRSVSFSSDGKTLASGSDDNTVRLWDVESQKPLAELNGHTHWVYSVSFSPDGKTVASGSEDKTVRLWDVDSQKLLTELKGHTENVRSVSFSPDGKMLASGSYDNTVQLWDVERQKPLIEPKGHNFYVTCVKFSPDGKILASGSGDKTVRLWDVERQKPLAELKGHTEDVFAISFSPDGKTLASGSSDKTIRLWDVESQKLITKLEASDYVRSVSFSPDNKTLASGCDSSLEWWDVESHKPLTEPMCFTYKIRSVSFSPDGKTLASGCDDSTVRLWDVESQKLLAELKSPPHFVEAKNFVVSSVLFSPDGKTLASGRSDNTVQLWDVESHKPLTELEGHTKNVNCISFSPDGKTLASGSIDCAIRLWDVETQKTLALLEYHTDRVNSVSFSPDGKTLASGSDDNTVRLWDIESQNGNVFEERNYEDDEGNEKCEERKLHPTLKCKFSTSLDLYTNNCLFENVIISKENQLLLEL